MQQQEEDRSAHRFVLEEAKDQTQLLVDWQIAKVKRECNLVANELAHVARRNTRTAVWLGRAPTRVAELIIKMIVTLRANQQSSLLPGKKVCRRKAN
jgi:hypothetical protein